MLGPLYHWGAPMDRTTRSLFFKLVVLIAVALGFSMLMGRVMWPGDMGPGTMPHGWGRGLGMGIGGLAMLAFWGALAIGVMLLARSLGGGKASFRRSSPLDILKRRYAQGEITRDQYDQMRKDLAE